MASDERIADVADVPADSTHLVTLLDRERGEEVEAILVRTDGKAAGAETDGDGEANADGDAAVTGWLNYCQHLTHIALDKGSGAQLRDGEIVCTNHGAYFERDTGRCTFGPCEGAYLNDVAVAVRDGGVYLVDDGYEFVAAGGIEDNDFDLSSSSNVEF